MAYIFALNGRNLLIPRISPSALLPLLSFSPSSTTRGHAQASSRLSLHPFNHQSRRSRPPCARPSSQRLRPPSHRQHRPLSRQARQDDRDRNAQKEKCRCTGRLSCPPCQLHCYSRRDRSVPPLFSSLQYLRDR